MPYWFYLDHSDKNHLMDKLEVNKKVEDQAVRVREAIKVSLLRTVLMLTGFQDLNWEERFEWVQQRRLKGNRLYKQKKVDEALNVYFESMMAIDLSSPIQEVFPLSWRLQI